MSIDFAQPIFYDGQGFLVRKDSGFDATSDLAEATICVQPGTTREQNVADHFTDIGLTYEQARGLLNRNLHEFFFASRCDVLTADVSDLASRSSRVRHDGGDYKILPQIISKEPLAPAVRDYDSEWRDVVNWVVHGLIAAEELGITQAHVAQLAANPPNARVARLLGVSFWGDEIATLGFEAIGAQFIQRAIAAVGNYGEIYARTTRRLDPARLLAQRARQRRLGLLPAGPRAASSTRCRTARIEPAHPGHSMSARRWRASATASAPPKSSSRLPRWSIVSPYGTTSSSARRTSRTSTRCGS